MDHGGILLHDHEAKEWLVNTLYENKQCCFSSLDVHTSFSRPPCSERKLEKHIAQSSLNHRKIWVNFVVLDLVPPESLKEIYDSFMRYLIAWQHAACECQLKSLKLFKLRPKHHSTDHLAAQMKRTKLNARKVMSCFPDESFLGVWRRLALSAAVSLWCEGFFNGTYCTCPFVGAMPECFSWVLCGDRWWAPTGVKKTGFPNDKRNTKPWHHGSWHGMFPLFSVTFWRWWIKTTIPIEHMWEQLSSM